MTRIVSKELCTSYRTFFPVFRYNVWSPPHDSETLGPARNRINPRPVRGGGLMQPPPPWVFLSWTPHRLENRAEIFHSLWGILCATFGEKKKLVGSGQVTKLWRHKRNNLRKISAKSWVNATWRGAIELNGDSWWDWCQYMTGCDPWHCARWGSRSTKVTWGHWPRLNSQWQITDVNH